MKKYALLASLSLILFVSSCAKDDLYEENTNLELTKKDKPHEDEWDKHLKNNETDTTLNVTVFSGSKK